MVSNLHSNAVASLSTGDLDALTTFTEWFGQSHAHGKKLLANVRRESHLVGDGDFGEPKALAAFLIRCAVGHGRPKSSPQRMRNYGLACGACELKGLRVPRGHLPRTLLRYSASRAAAAALVERVLGKAARRDFDNGILQPEDAFARIAELWPPLEMSESDRLAGGAAVFATFDAGTNAPRDSAFGMAEALALGILMRPPGDEDILFEFSYDTNTVRGYRFPTVGDAGTFPLFEPAPEIEPDTASPQTCCGWTKPLGQHEPQPEIVHENESLRVLGRSPRLVGRIGR